MRPSLFLLPTVLVIAVAVACQPAADTQAARDAVGPASNASSAPAAASAPVAAAAADGAAPIEAFRATGNEPGWLAEVGEAGLRVEVDYGQTTYDVAAPTQGPDGWAGNAADGTPVKLSIERVPCQDDMSGTMFDAKAMLTVGTRQLHGCGSFSSTP